MDDEVYRRQILARSRNYLLAYALRNQEWALWIDVDIVWVRSRLCHNGASKMWKEDRAGCG